MNLLSFAHLVTPTYCLREPGNAAGNLFGHMIMKINRLSHLLTASVLLSALLAASAADKPNYHLTKTIQVGGEGGWDYLSMDSAGRRLYVSHASKAVVIDLDKEEVVGEIADTPGIHGIAIAADLAKLSRAMAGKTRSASWI